MIERIVVAAVLLGSFHGCNESRHASPVAPTDAASPTAARDVVAPHDSGTDAARAPVADGAPGVFEGHAEGRGVDPPIHEFAAHVVADTWSGHGTAHLEIPAHDGLVTGTITMPGLAFAVRGRRFDNHVRATIDQTLGGGSIPAATEPFTDAGPPEGLFRGMLDGDLTGTSLHATWEASAGAGVHRRNGTLDVQR